MLQRTFLSVFCSLSPSHPFNARDLFPRSAPQKGEKSAAAKGDLALYFPSAILSLISCPTTTLLDTDTMSRLYYHVHRLELLYIPDVS